MKPALLFYCQHSVGLGHLMRSYALADALASATASRCSPAASCPTGIDPPADVELVALPPLGVKPRRTASAAATRATPPSAPGRSAPSASSKRCATRSRGSCSSSCSRSGARSSPASSCRCCKQAREQGAFTACSLRDILVSARANQREHDDRAATAGQRAPRRRARALRPALRPPRGDLQPEHPAARAGPLHRLRHAQPRRRPRDAASTSSSPRAADGSARRCSRRRCRRATAARCARSPAR